MIENTFVTDIVNDPDPTEMMKTSVTVNSHHTFEGHFWLQKITTSLFVTFYRLLHFMQQVSIAEGHKAISYTSR